MKKNVRTMVYLMILVVVAGGIYLWNQSGSGEDLLGGLNPKSYDVEATCSEIKNQNLVCNKGNDTYLYLDDVKVFLQKSDTVVNENGDEETKVSYKNSSISKLKQEIEENKEVSIYMWLTAAGKAKTIMITEQSFENNNASLANLEGLDPASYTSSNMILSMNKKGMKLAPINYSASEKDKFQGFIKTYKFAKNVKYYDETVTITVDADNQSHKNTQYEKSSYQKMKDKLSEPVSAFVWFDKKGDICAVMTFTEKTVRD